MPTARARMRNTWVEFASTPGEIRGGLAASNSLTAAQFLDMIYVVFSAPGGFSTRFFSTDVPLAATNNRIPHGRYILTPHLPNTEMAATDEQFHPRTLSLSSRTQEDGFRNQIRQRDHQCVISGERTLEAEWDLWSSFEAAHIFPLSLYDIFTRCGFAQIITHNNPPAVDSPQNGLLLRSDVHRLWDHYSVAVIPNDGYRVYSFLPQGWKFHGRILHPVCRDPNNPRRVIDVLLRWHFEQAVLCNLRGGGEPSFEFDFPDGTDMMGEIRDGPQAAERMEAELFNRFTLEMSGGSKGGKTKFIIFKIADNKKEVIVDEVSSEQDYEGF